MDFLKLLKRLLKTWEFIQTFKTVKLQDIIDTTLVDNINITIIKLFLFVATYIPSAETQAKFNDSIKNTFTLPYDSWYTDQKLVRDALEFQIDEG